MRRNGRHNRGAGGNKSGSHLTGRGRSLPRFDSAFRGILSRPARRRLAEEALRRYHTATLDDVEAAERDEDRIRALERQGLEIVTGIARP